MLLQYQKVLQTRREPARCNKIRYSQASVQNSPLVDVESITASQ
jgi:hypothetical protein